MPIRQRYRTLLNFSCFDFFFKGDCDCALGCTGYIRGDGTCDRACNVSACSYDSGNLFSLSLFSLILQQETAHAPLDADSTRSITTTAKTHATYRHAGLTGSTAVSFLAFFR